MTYRFKASNYGTSWYHSHFALQTYEGVFGPMIIHGPVSTTQTIDAEQMITLQDWSHVPINAMYDAAQDVGPTPKNGPRTLDTGLINGMNIWGNDGAAGTTGKRFSMTVTKGKTYKLRVLNSAIQSTFAFSVDGHSMTVIANDYVPIVPYKTNVLMITTGQRYDVLVTMDQAVGDYWIVPTISRRVRLCRPQVTSRHLCTTQAAQWASLHPRPTRIPLVAEMSLSPAWCHTTV